MFDWIFGSKKEEAKEENQKETEDNKLGHDQKWVYDFIRQYLISPIWRNPLLDFMEENCLAFEDTQENKFEYTKVFQQFTGLSALLLESMIEETGVTERQLQKCIIKGLKSQKEAKIFQQILICDNFEAFKKIMVSKNKQLELQVLKKLQTEKKQPRNQGQIAIDAKQLQRIQIQKAIAMSLALESKANSQEEKQLEEALRLSHISYEKQEEKKKYVAQVQQKVQQKPVPAPSQKKHLDSLPPLIGTTKAYRPIQQFKAEENKLKVEIEELKKKQEERRLKESEQKESSQQRKKRLLQQRELIRKKKQEQRKEELTNFVQNKQQTTQSKVSEEQMQRRRNLMKKLKAQLKQ